MPVVHCLSIHARYRCADSGACCTSGWPIAVDAGGARGISRAIAQGILRPRGRQPLVDRGADGGERIACDAAGCVFHDGEGRRCEVHRALGHDALPLACRQFPRVSLHDPRGVSVTLSHYCPTAAALLDTNRPVQVVSGAPAFPSDAEYVGLDASGVLPPLLRPGMLMDWEAWWECERLAVDLLGNFDGDPSDALAHLAGAVRQMQRWTPACTLPLIEAVREAFATPRPDPGALSPAAALLAEMSAEAPPGPRRTERRSRTAGHIVNRFLAAHAFANWIAYGRAGMNGWLRSIERAHALIATGLTVRDADLWLRHR